MRKRWLAALPLVGATLVFGIFAATATGSGKRASSGGVFRLGTASGIDAVPPQTNGRATVPPPKLSRRVCVALARRSPILPPWAA